MRDAAPPRRLILIKIAYGLAGLFVFVLALAAH